MAAWVTQRERRRKPSRGSRHVIIVQTPVGSRLQEIIDDSTGTLGVDLAVQSPKTDPLYVLVVR